MIVSTNEYNTQNPMQFDSVLSVRSPYTSVSGPIPKFDQMILHDVAQGEHNATTSPRLQLYQSFNKQKEHTGFYYCIQWY